MRSEFNSLWSVCEKVLDPGTDEWVEFEIGQFADQEARLNNITIACN